MAPGGPGDPYLELEVLLVEELGSEAFVYGAIASQAGDEASQQLVVRVDSGRSVTKGARIRVTTDTSRVHVFDADSGARISD